MARRIYPNDLVSKRYDHILIAMGAIEFDARLLNIVHTLHGSYSSILIIGLYTPGWKVSCSESNVDVLLLEGYTYHPMYQLWIDFYRWLYSFKGKLRAKSFWAMDLYTLPFVVRMADKKKKQSIYDSREVYSKLGEISDHPLKQKIIAFIERKYIKKVTKVFTSGPLDSKYLAQIYKIPIPEVIMNLPRFQLPVTSNRLRSYFQIPDDIKIMVYQGVIHPGRGLKKIVQILPDMPGWVLCILGSGNVHKKQLEEIASSQNIGDRLYFRDPVPYTELLEWTSSADLGLCLIEPLSLSLEYALPNKLFEYVMAGIPPVISDLPQMTPYVKKYQCGIIIPTNADNSSIVRIIKHASDSTSFLPMKENTRKLAEEMNWENQSEKVLRIAGNQ